MKSSINSKVKSNNQKLSKSIIICIVFLIILIPIYIILVVSNKYKLDEYTIIGGLSILLISTLLPYYIFDKKEKNDIDKKMGITLILSIPLVIAKYVTEIIYDSYFIINLMIIFFTFYLLLLIFRNIKIAGIIVFAFSLFVTIMNDILMQVRGTVLVVSDIYAIKTALTVSSNYKYKLSSSTLTAILITILFLILIINCKFKFSDIKYKAVTYTFISAVFAGCVLLSVMNITSKDVLRGNDAWVGQDNNKYTGMYYNILDNLINGRYEKPQNYSQRKAESILKAYTDDEDIFQPNLIVVMSESFSDLHDIAEFTTNQDISPFIDNLKKNTMRGNAIVSGYGGGTCNSEFEFLTGMASAFIPADTFAYLQYINSNTKSLAWDLNSNFEKKYIHPYIASNYKRSAIFSLLGFDEFIDGLKFSTSDFYENEYKERNLRVEYSGVNLLRDFISDKDLYDRMIEIYENKAEDEKLFEFAISMQNHSPYNYEGDDFNSYIYMNEKSNNEEAINQYLTIVNITDNETKRLVEYFENTDEDTVIVFFGDHKPYFEEICNQTISENNLNDIKAKYTVPFFIWTNYETEYNDVGDISLNYLSALMKKHSGMALNKFDKFRLDVFEEYPVISPKVIIDSNDVLYPTYTKLRDKAINDYEIVQYYYMTGNAYND